MRRRSLLLSIVSAPALSAAEKSKWQQPEVAAHADKRLPVGPTPVPPGISETPTIPVVTATDTSEVMIATFDAEQFSALARLGEVLVPAWNGKPGSKEAGTPEFLDFLVGCSPPEQVELYRRGLSELNQRARTRFGKPFAQITNGEAEVLLAPLREAWSYATAAQDDFRAFLMAAKRDVLRATVNSHPYIDAVSEERRPRNASGFYWLPID